MLYVFLARGLDVSNEYECSFVTKWILINENQMALNSINSLHFVRSLRYFFSLIFLPFFIFDVILDVKRTKQINENQRVKIEQERKK